MDISGARREFALTDLRRRAFAGEIALPLRTWVELMMMRHDIPADAPSYPDIRLKVEKPVKMKVRKWRSHGK